MMMRARAASAVARARSIKPVVPNLPELRNIVRVAGRRRRLSRKTEQRVLPSVEPVRPAYRLLRHGEHRHCQMRGEPRVARKASCPPAAGGVGGLTEWLRSAIGLHCLAEV